MSFPDFQLLESEKLQPTILEVECILREATPEQLKNVRVLPAKRGVLWLIKKISLRTGLLCGGNFGKSSGGL
ncbi:32729_t:CDS:2 [Racocetra persica]|uniref:32729_t:CDS:1 n=1 Tax=Racocetra persica TaxID=160502 RepID=A0ACA9RI95_9GLOM|nr:32729_t:CDS:2 [Racocetra persica]